jgi:hypothetical protein
VRAKYHGGVQKRGAHNKGSKLHRTATVNTAAYTANKALDRDRDGLACEV